jgi:hypothetical protein
MVLAFTPTFALTPSTEMDEVSARCPFTTYDPEDAAKLTTPGESSSSAWNVPPLSGIVLIAA